MIIKLKKLIEVRDELKAQIKEKDDAIYELSLFYDVSFIELIIYLESYEKRE